MVTDIDRLIKKAPRATCGVFEKEMNVRAENLPKRVKQLKSRGYRVLGTSYGKTKIKKIWFVPMGTGSL